MDTRTIETKEQFTELLNALSERLPAVISHESGARLQQEQKQAVAAAFVEMERKLEGLSHFNGISAGDIPMQTHDERCKKRHEQAVYALNFLNSYDFFAQERKGTAPAGFDPHLMRIIVNAVKAHAAYEGARGEILQHLAVPSSPATQAPAAPFEEVIISSRADK